MSIEQPQAGDNLVRTSVTSSTQYASPGQNRSLEFSPGGEWRVEDWDPDAYNDWNTETTKPADQKGIRYIDPQLPWIGISYYRTMLWTCQLSQWYGTWAWAKWDEKKLREHRIAGVVTIPMEMLLYIIECSVQVHVPNAVEFESAIRNQHWDIVQRWRRCDRRGLYNLALVCRAWYTRLAPLLYSELFVNNSSIAEICAVLPTPTRFARVATVRGLHEYSTSARLARRAGHVFWLVWDPESRTDTSIVHPLNALVYLRLHASFTNVLRLDISQGCFQSTLDLQRLLASFPSLIHFAFSDISVTRLPPPARLLQRSNLQRITRRDDHVVSNGLVSSLAIFFTWHQSRSMALPYTFPGISWVEGVNLVYMLLDLASSRTSSLYLDSVDGGRTWVASCYTEDIHLEFYAAAEQHAHSSHSGTAYIRHIVIRFRREDVTPDFENGRDAFSKIAEDVAQLRFLESVVLENRGATSASDALAEALRSQGVEVHQRTCEQAHALHMKAKNIAYPPSENSYLSPFWCLTRHFEEWRKWLPAEYLDSLGLMYQNTLLASSCRVQSSPCIASSE